MKTPWGFKMPHGVFISCIPEYTVCFFAFGREIRTSLANQLKIEYNKLNVILIFHKGSVKKVLLYSYHTNMKEEF
jgi:hypothetical protein